MRKGCHTGPLQTFFSLETVSGESNWGWSGRPPMFPAQSFVFFSFKFYFQQLTGSHGSEPKGATGKSVLPPPTLGRHFLAPETTDSPFVLFECAPLTHITHFQKRVC